MVLPFLNKKYYYCSPLPILLIALFFIQRSEAQTDSLYFKLYDHHNGLSSSSIWGILQDKKGFIWAGTDWGLNRFDGNMVYNFFETSKDIAISNNIIFNLYPLKGDEIGVATRNYVTIINTNNFKTLKLYFPSDSVIKYWANSIKGVAKDCKGNYGVVTGVGFYIFNNKGTLIKSYQRHTTPEVLSGLFNFGSKIFYAPDSSICIFTKDKEVLNYNYSSNKIEQASNRFPFYAQLEHNKVNDFIVSPDLSMYILSSSSHELLIKANLSDPGITMQLPSEAYNLFAWNTSPIITKDSLLVLNIGTKLYYRNIQQQYRHKADFKYVDLKSYIMRLYLDSEQRLWCGTRRGLFKQELRVLPIQSKYYSITGKSIKDIIIDSDKIYVGTRDVEVYVINKKSNSIIKKIYTITNKKRK